MSDPQRNLPPALTTVTEKTFSQALSFVRQREYACVGLSSRLCVGGKALLPSPSSGELVMIKASQEIQGVVFLSSNGILTHCLSKDIPKEGLQGLAEFMCKRRVRCILGETQGTSLFEALHPGLKIRSVDYNLMLHEVAPSQGSCTLPPPFVVSRAEPEDAEFLLELQEGYEKEEVIPPGDPFSPQACLTNLRITLEKQRVHMITREGIALAKAGTNAQGFDWDQIGGVYTHPLWRGKGLGSALIERIKEEAGSMSRKLSLFVKTENLAAQRVYQRAGFQEAGNFRIAYYE
jgi:predicted GNAT family acetyltransferase